METPPPRTATAAAADASTNLDTTPLGAADYALYANIMGGASALLRSTAPDDRAAFDFARKVDAGTATASTPAERALLASARALQHKDEELADLQGIGVRYRQVKAKVEAVIGRRAKPPAAGDTLALENLHFLEAHRANIERLQNVLRDPLNTP
jgi:hypothetical protein